MTHARRQPARAPAALVSTSCSSQTRSAPSSPFASSPPSPTRTARPSPTRCRPWATSRRCAQTRRQRALALRPQVSRATRHWRPVPARGLFIPPLIAGGAQERGERAGTENLAGIVGMATALEEACEHLAADMIRISTLRDELIDHLLGARQRHPPPHRRAHHRGLEGRLLPRSASFTCNDVNGELLVVLLDRAGVAAATGSGLLNRLRRTIARPHRNGRRCHNDKAHGALRLSLASNATAEASPCSRTRLPLASAKRASSAPRGNGPSLNNGPPPRRTHSYRQAPKLLQPTQPRRKANDRVWPTSTSMSGLRSWFVS